MWMVTQKSTSFMNPSEMVIHQSFDKLIAAFRAFFALSRCGQRAMQ
jgi:hypothetical protein